MQKMTTLFKKSKFFLSLAIILMLALASLTPVLANGAAVTGDPARAAIAKVFQMPTGTAVPDATFVFSARPVSVDGQDYDYGNMPDLNVDQIYYPGGTATQSGDMTVYVQQTGDIFANVAWPHAGIYTYEITEDPYTYSIADPNHETITFSGAVYEITAYVQEDGSGNLYVSDIVDVIVTADNDTQVVNDKIDPTPDGNSVTNTGYSDMTFTNTYVHTNGSTDPNNPDPVNDPATLKVSKTVAGSFADRSMYFDFSMTLTPPSLVTDPPAFYRAYVVEDGVVVTSTDNADSSLLGSDNGGVYIMISTNAATSFSLRDGQTIAFIDTPVGTLYDVTELGSPDYIPTVSITSDGNLETITNATANVSLDTNIRLVGESVNYAAFLNTHEEVTPTGLRINDVPFIVLIAVGAGALVAFVAVKARRSKNTER